MFFVVLFENLKIRVTPSTYLDNILGRVKRPVVKFGRNGYKRVRLERFSAPTVTFLTCLAQYSAGVTRYVIIHH